MVKFPSFKYTLWDCRTGLKMRMQNIWCFFARPCSSCLTSHQIHFKLKINQGQMRRTGPPENIWSIKKLLVNVSDWLIPSRPKIFCPSKNLWKLTRGGWLISSRPIRDSSRASYPRTGSTHAKYPGSIFPPPPFHAAPPSHTLPPSTHLPSVQTLHVPKTWFCDCTN